MQICCLDLEGILVPEVWIAVAERFKLQALRLTTRDLPDYDRLMRHRLRILKKEGIRLPDIQRVIGGMKPLPGAVEFLRELRRTSLPIVLSDTYYEFAGPFMEKLGHPTLLCNWLRVNRAGTLTGYRLRQKEGKRKAVQAFKRLGFVVKAVGDSFNDLAMLKAAHQGILFNPPPAIRQAYPHFPVARSYEELLNRLKFTTSRVRPYGV